MQDYSSGGTQVHARVTSQNRQPVTSQTVSGAAVYLLHLPSPAAGISGSISSVMKSEMQAHVNVLRNTSAILVLLTTSAEGSDSAGSDIGAGGLVRDLSLLQLTNENRSMHMTEMSDIIQSIGDDTGRMSIVSKFQSRRSGLVAIGVRFQPFIGGK